MAVVRPQVLVRRAVRRLQPTAALRFTRLQARETQVLRSRTDSRELDGALFGNEDEPLMKSLAKVEDFDPDDPRWTPKTSN